MSTFRDRPSKCVQQAGAEGDFDLLVGTETTTPRESQ